MNLYCTHDKISGSDILFSLAPNDGAYVRWAVTRLSIPFVDAECKLVIKDVDCSDCPSVPWSLYKFPESQMDNLKPFEMSKEEEDRYYQMQMRIDELRKRQ